MQASASGGWYRLDYGDATVFWHVEPQGSPAFASHGHCDTGAFSLYWQGTPILVDPGRFNYREDDPLGMYGVSARAHNAVLVDGFEPFIYWRRSRFPASFRARPVEVGHADEGESVGLTIRHDGFSRIASEPLVLARAFRVFRDRFVIEDRLEGISTRTIETCFQWAPHVGLVRASDDGSFRVDSPAGSIGTFRVEPQGDAPDAALASAEIMPPAGWYFRDYGQKERATTLAFRSQVRLPYACRYVLSWHN